MQKCYGDLTETNIVTVKLHLNITVPTVLKNHLQQNNKLQVKVNTNHHPYNVIHCIDDIALQIITSFAHRKARNWDKVY